jgi:hypothetical protein
MAMHVTTSGTGALDQIVNALTAPSSSISTSEPVVSNLSG